MKFRRGDRWHATSCHEISGFLQPRAVHAAPSGMHTRAPSKRRQAPSPHDALFRGIFGAPLRAAELMRRLVPWRLARRFDWSSLRAVECIFVDETLRDQRADLLFTIRLSGSRNAALPAARAQVRALSAYGVPGGALRRAHLGALAGRSSVRDVSASSTAVRPFPRPAQVARAAAAEQAGCATTLAPVRASAKDASTCSRSNSKSALDRCPKPC